MKKNIIAMIAIASIVCMASVVRMAIYAQTNEKAPVEDERLIKLESTAEQGDTAAMHRLMEFYN